MLPFFSLLYRRFLFPFCTAAFFSPFVPLSFPLLYCFLFPFCTAFFPLLYRFLFPFCTAAFFSPLTIFSLHGKSVSLPQKFAFSWTIPMPADAGEPLLWSAEDKVTVTGYHKGQCRLPTLPSSQSFLTQVNTCSYSGPAGVRCVVSRLMMVIKLPTSFRCLWSSSAVSTVLTRR